MKFPGRQGRQPMRYEGVYPPGLLGGQLGNDTANESFTPSSRPACRRCQYVTDPVYDPGRMLTR